MNMDLMKERYTLCVERIREIATIRVLGFNKKETESLRQQAILQCWFVVITILFWS